MQGLHEAGGDGVSFELGGEDFTANFQLPSRIYGRTAERAALTQAFAGIAESQGRRTIALTGPLGIGKSALIRELETLVVGSAGGSDERLFDIVDHLQTGAPADLDAGQRLELAGLNLRASERARDAAACDLAQRYFAQCSANNAGQGIVFMAYHGSVFDLDAIVCATPDQLGVRCGAVLIWVTSGSLDAVPLERVRDALEAMAPDQPQGVALLLICVGAGELPQLRTRRRIARELSTLGDRLQAVAVALEGDKPWLARARMSIEEVFTHVEVNMFGGLPMRLFGDRVDGILWLGEVVIGPDQRPIETEALSEAVDEACTRVWEQARAAPIKEYKSEP